MLLFFSNGLCCVFVVFFGSGKELCQQERKPCLVSKLFDLVVARVQIHIRFNIVTFVTSAAVCFVYICCACIAHCRTYIYMYVFIRETLYRKPITCIYFEV